MSNLNCGIFAFVGISSDKFSPFLFNVLGVYNDSRGGDSSGVYFNKGSITGIKTEAKYEALVKAQKLHTTIKLGKYPVAIAHCRKASVGTVNEINVQPTLIRNAAKSDRLMYVQAHNGTITNYKELAKKYDVEIKTDESDSVIMSKLIEKEGFKILGEYEGSAALLMYFTKEPNVVYAFHGQSKNYTVLTEERPLHFLNIKGIGTYISSEGAPLEFIGNGEKAESFKYNVIYKLSGDSVEEFQKVEREKAVLRKYSGFDYTNNYQNDTYPRSANYYALPPKKDDLIQINVTRNLACSRIETSAIEINLDKRVRFEKGFFFIGKDYANGEITCDAWGYLRTPSLYVAGNHMEIFYLYFYYGVLLANKKSLKDVQDAGKACGITNGIDLYQQSKYNVMSSVLALNSIFPITRLASNPGCGYMEPSILCPNDDKNINSTFFCGEFTPLFTDYVLYFKDGDFLGYKKLKGIYTIDDFVTDYPELPKHVAFGKKPIDADASTSVTSCKECQDKVGYQNYEACMSCTKEFKTNKPAIDNKLKNCTNCGDKSCNYFGMEEFVMDQEEDTICEYWVSASEGEMIAQLSHTIAEQVNPIIGDMDDLINEIEVSGFSNLVGEKLTILTSANNKLKEIIK